MRLAVVLRIVKYQRALREDEARDRAKDSISDHLLCNVSILETTLTRRLILGGNHLFELNLSSISSSPETSLLLGERGISINECGKLDEPPSFDEQTERSRENPL